MGDLDLARAIELGATANSIAKLFAISTEQAIALGAPPTVGDEPADFLADEQVMVHGALLANLVATATRGMPPTPTQLVDVFNAFRVMMEGGPRRINFDAALELLSQIKAGLLFQRRCERCRALILTAVASSVCPFGMNCRLA